MSDLRRRLVKLALDQGGLLAVLALAVYILIAPAHIVDGDNAEFATLGALGGTAHPTGYPLYILWMRAWSWLPGASAAHTAAISTALLGAAQVIVLHAACRAWGARPRAADVAVIMFAASPVVIAMNTEAEVFAMNNLVVALVLWFASVGSPLRGVRRCIALALVAGLGLSDHVTCVLVSGVGVLGFIRGLRETEHKAIACAAGAGALAVGLTPYLYLLIAPDHFGTWGHASSLRDVLNMFLRSDYGGPSTFAARIDERFPAENAWFLAQTIGRAYLWLPAILGLGTLGYRIARPTGETRWGWALLAASFLLAGPILASRFNLDPNDGITAYVIERFHLMPLVLLVVPVACGLDLAVGAAVDRIPGTLLRRRALAIVFVAGGFVAAVGLSLPHIMRTHTPAVQELVINALRSMPERAVIIGEADDMHNGSSYVQLVLGIRRDVDYVNWPMMTLPWYRARKASHGVRLQEGPGHASVRIAEHVLREGRPLFVDPTAQNILRSFPHYPYGIFYRVLPRDAKPPPIEEVFATNKDILSRYELSYARPGTNDRWPTAVHMKYAWTWRVLARSLERAGRDEDAAWALAAAREIGPQP